MAKAEGGEVGAMTGTASVTIEKIDADEAWQVFDETSHRILGISADELVRRWDAHEPINATRREIMRVLILRPSGR